MKLILLTVLTSVISYLLGCLNAAYFYSTKVKKTDIREYGSGNAGSTNILRVFGLKSALPVFAVDVLKAVAALRVTIWITGGNPIAVILSAIFVICGHNWPIFLQYRGGKGVASSLGIMFALDYRVALILLAVAVATMLISKMVSLGSVVGLTCAPFVMWWLSGKPEYIIIAAILAGIGIFQHRTNLVRIAKGQESKFGKKQTDQ
ncbi:MAG: glycerol-3-phosphate 1-O-acyltransferase PlsY [Anaerofustis sp.]